MDVSKIHIKVGIVEFSGEGDPEWLSGQIDKILEKVPLLLKLELNPHPPPAVPATSTADGKAPAAVANYSMVNVASKLKAKACSGLAVAAAAYLRFVGGKSSFTREEILKAMQSATGYYEKNYRNNLSTTLTALIKNDTLVQGANDSYSLSATKETELNAAFK